MLNISYLDKHKFYNFIVGVFSSTGYDIYYLKTLSSQYESKNCSILFKMLLLCFDVFYIAFTCYRFNKKDFIFLREFNTVPFIFTALLLYPIRKKVLLNVNHNFQRANKSKLHLLSLVFFDYLGFRYFCFESDLSSLDLKHKPILIPFLMSGTEINISSVGVNPKIGVVGAYRKEKGMELLLESLNTIRSDGFSLCDEFILGTDHKELLGHYQNKGWAVYDTTEYKYYTQALDSVDILIFNYLEDDYFYRHSGVITDAIAKGKIVIVPDYPYFSAQVNTPSAVGVTFQNLSMLSNALESACLLFSSREIMGNIHRYTDYRSLDSVSNKLALQLGELK